ncbi:ATP-binding protein [Streptomyces sp. NPDC058877]|uniref:ATP-binding protein n=1 Tax=Streptomyces sp. NPDC058877 TaxID=3346665 RepID=UPI00369998AD
MWTRSEGHEAPFVGYHRDGHALIGRDEELAVLRTALAGHRLVTVTGAAGTGKSRLALAAVSSLPTDPCRTVVRVRWHDGVPVGRRALTARVTRALGATGLSWEPGGTCPRTADRPAPPGGVLLFLDDVDPVHTEGIGLVQTLLMALPTVRVLVTARRSLGLGDETVLRLEPLWYEPGADRARSSPAAELLLSRARAHGWRGEPDPTAVTRVCRLLEGVPLALELAAGRLGEWTMEELADHLESGPCRLADPAPLLRRHRTLRTSMGAVHALCEPAARKVWRRLSVFAGTFTEAAAVPLCSGVDLAPHEVPPALATLSATGVLQVHGEAGGVRQHRYRMARAARDFGAERLSAAGEGPVTRDLHAAHVLGTAAVAETLWTTGLQRQALRTVQDEHDDLVALVRRCATGAGHVEEALQAVLHLWFWWVVQERAEEGSAHLHVLLARLPSSSPLAAYGQWLAAWLGATRDPRTAQRLLSLAWPAAVLAGDDALLGRIAHVHGTLAWRRQDAETAVRYYRQAAETTPRGAPGGPPPSVSLAALAVAQAHRTPAAAVRTARRALAQPTCANDAWAAALAHYARAFADHRAGRTGRARHHARRALTELESRLDAPQAHRALRRLLAALEPGATATAPAPQRLRHVPGPRDGASKPPAAATPAQR